MTAHDDIPLQLRTPAETQRILADRTRDARLAIGLKQTTLADRSGVTLASLRRFEQTGEISLKYLLKILHALGRLDEFDSLLQVTAPLTMAELEARHTRTNRRRGRR